MKRKLEETAKINGENIEFKKGKMPIKGEFQEVVSFLETIHNIEIETKNSEIKDEKDKLPPYKLQRIILVFSNGRTEAKRNIIAEE